VTDTTTYEGTVTGCAVTIQIYPMVGARSTEFALHT